MPGQHLHLANQHPTPVRFLMEVTVAESQQRRNLLGRWRDSRLWWLLGTVVLAGRAWVMWGLAGLAIACGIAVVGWLIVRAVVMPGRLAPPLHASDLAGVRDPKARLEAIDARTRLHHDLRNGALQLLTVVAVLAGAIVAFQQLAEDRDQAREDRDKAIQDRQLTRQGQASERFTRAIDQLRSSRMETRIGGIYALDQIAEQAPENTRPVGEVLLAWLNSGPRPRTPPDTPLREHAPDIQAALTVLTGQRYPSITAGRLNLHHLGLREATLPGAHLTGADLRDADLRDANLRDANLGGAYLDAARLDGANLREARLDGAMLRNAFLGGATLFGAHLRAARLRGADLGGASLHHADLRGANLFDANLREANLFDANLRGTLLSRSDLRGADLSGADLRGAHLRGAKSDTMTNWPAGFDWRRAGVRRVS